MIRSWLVAYDITDRRRLQRVHRMVSRHALCLQQSVYLYSGSAAVFARWLDALAALIDPANDDLRVYLLPQQPQWWHLGPSLLPAGVIASVPLPIQLAGTPRPDALASTRANPTFSDPTFLDP